jgi:hypothetical protein
METLSLCSSQNIAAIYSKHGRKYTEEDFVQTWMAIFWGSFLIISRVFFNLSPKNGGSCFHGFLDVNYAIFSGMF